MTIRTVLLLMQLIRFFIPNTLSKERAAKLPLALFMSLPEIAVMIFTILSIVYSI